MSKTHTHTEKKITYPQHILQTHRKHIQNIKSKQNHISKCSFSFFDMLCRYFSHLPTINVTFFILSLLAFPLGGPPARTSGRQSQGDT